MFFTILRAVVLSTPSPQPRHNVVPHRSILDGRYTMPFFETTSATTPGGMLSYKTRDARAWEFVYHVGNHGRSQSFTNKIGGMTGNRIHSFFFQIHYFLSR